MSCQSPGEDITVNLKSANNTGRVGSIKGTIKKLNPKISSYLVGQSSVESNSPGVGSGLCH